MSNVALRYRWRPESGGNVLRGVDHGTNIGRVERSHTGNFWLWFMSLDSTELALTTLCSLNGAASTAAQAAAACEATYAARTLRSLP
ncbi:hypothetical protein IB279_03000 [Ensifer sp. ENS06]|uniref:hypothetical protein n=1 Tax=Ensifer sp. ENS06 TaxID=2769276 RepID=UPI001782A722|nr:hypothetical protein [Ensifer sp. ENS06]MBD9621906.1 hypothetical protein [Ensifer sp. ENS06]